MKVLVELGRSIFLSYNAVDCRISLDVCELDLLLNEHLAEQNVVRWPAWGIFEGQHKTAKDWTPDVGIEYPKAIDASSCAVAKAKSLLRHLLECHPIFAFAPLGILAESAASSCVVALRNWKKKSHCI